MLPKFNRNTPAINTGIATLILTIALFLVMLVGVGDAYKNYPRFITDKLGAQGQIVKHAIETFLSAGLPLEQFSGFSRLTQPLIDTDPDIARISAVDSKNKLVFDVTASRYATWFNQVEQQPQAAALTNSNLKIETAQYQLKQNNLFHQLTLPLKSKFEAAGELQIWLPKARLRQRINYYFYLVSIAALLALVGFSIAAFYIYRKLRRGSSAAWLDILYGGVYVLVASCVVAALTFLYSEGIQAKTQAITLSLSSRLNAPLELGLSLSNFEGLNQTFADYQKLNPEISYIALKSEGKTAITTTTTPTGEQTAGNGSDHFKYEIKLNPDGDRTLSLYTVLVKTPKDLLYSQLGRSVKNFLALFVASAFLSTLFLNLLKSFTYKPEPGSPAHEEFQLKRVEPFYFLGSFVDGLSISFLPQYLESLAVNSGATVQLVPPLFTIYFLGWALAMLPATSLANRKGVKPILLWVGLLNVLVALSMASVTNFYAMFLIRAIAGAGQGMLTVGVQSYILEAASSQKKTQGNDMMVFDFFGARLSSTAIGALLAAYVGSQGVFMVGTLIALSALVYGKRFIPSQISRPAEAAMPLAEAPLLQAQPEEQPGVTPGSNRLLSNIFSVIQDLQFVKTILLVGIPYRAIFTGVTVFALPLLLSRQNYLPEDIGQVMMFYAAGVLVSSSIISRVVDRVGHTDLVLFAGCACSGLGLVLVGLMDWDELWAARFPYLTIALVILGITILGFGHGFINAPSLTHITQTQASKTLGQTTTGSLYRLLERSGQIAGPLIVGQLLIWGNKSALTISWLGVASLVLGILFLLGFNRQRQPISS